MRRRGAALLAVLLILIPGSPAPSPRYLYTILEGPTSSIWSSDGPRLIAQVQHHDGYGIRARLSPDGAMLAHTLLAASGELWVLRLADGSSGRLLAGVDVHSTPVWSPDGTHVVVRRETALISVDVETGQVATLLPESPVQGVYPFDWRPEGLYYAVINGGTDVFRNTEHVLRASEGIARDFRFVRDQLVYNEVTPGGLRLAGEVSRPVGLPANAEFIGWLP